MGQGEARIHVILASLPSPALGVSASLFHILFITGVPGSNKALFLYFQTLGGHPSTVRWRFLSCQASLGSSRGS